MKNNTKFIIFKKDVTLDLIDFDDHGNETSITVDFKLGEIAAINDIDEDMTDEYANIVFNDGSYAHKVSTDVFEPWE